MSRYRNSRRRPAIVGVLLIGATTFCGCRMFDSGKISGTMGYQQQMAEITRIAPYGTPRPKAVASLEKAGVIGEYSRAGNSIYYCQLWNRPDGKRWHMTVALLFNAKDEFYAVNLADADIQQGDAGGSTTGTQSPGKARVNPSRRPSGGTSPVPWPDEKSRTSPAFPEPATTDPRVGRRTPFESEQR
jgi:hypothetical protein